MARSLAALYSVPDNQAASNSSSEPGGNARPGEASDEDLVRGVFAGNPRSFEPLVLRYEKRIYSHLVRIVGHVEEAEDLTQETFVRAFTRLSTFNPERRFKAWLYRIATNLALSALRKRKPMTVSLDEAIENGGAFPDASPGIDCQVDKRRRVELIEQGIEVLPATARAVFQMRYGDDLSMKEIAEAVGKKPGAVATILHRARLQLRDIVLADFDDSPREKLP